VSYEDLGGRINAEHLTTEEWALLEKAAKEDGYFIPTDDDWLAVRGVLAMVDIRRGFKEEKTGVIQLGWANIRINEHGREALAHRANGTVYRSGEKLSYQDVIDRMPEARRRLLWQNKMTGEK
jgi:hypothetical protein